MFSYGGALCMFVFSIEIYTQMPYQRFFLWASVCKSAAILEQSNPVIEHWVNSFKYIFYLLCREDILCNNVLYYSLIHQIPQYTLVFFMWGENNGGLWNVLTNILKQTCRLWHRNFMNLMVHVIIDALYEPFLQSCVGFCIHVSFWLICVLCNNMTFNRESEFVPGGHVNASVNGHPHVTLKVTDFSCEGLHYIELCQTDCCESGLNVVWDHVWLVLCVFGRVLGCGWIIKISCCRLRWTPVEMERWYSPLTTGR